MPQHFWPLALTMAGALAACHSTTSGDTDLSGPVIPSPAPRHLSIAAVDTAWTRSFWSPDAILDIRVSNIGVHAFDFATKRVTLVSKAGDLRWQTDPKSATLRLGDIRDIEVDAIGHTYLLDALSRKILVLDSLGRLVDSTSTAAVGPAERLIVLGDGRYVLHPFGALSFPVLARTGKIDGHLAIKWPALDSARPLARQLVTSIDPRTGQWVVASLLGGGWTQGRDIRAGLSIFPYLESRPLPAVMTVVNKNGSSDSFVRYAPCTACDVAVSDSRLLILAGGSA